MARAWGCSSAEAIRIYPIPSKINQTYFQHFPGTSVNVGDIIIMGPKNPVVPVENLNQSTGHAAYVHEILASNNGDGRLWLGPMGVWRDDDPIVSDAQVILHQISNEGATSVTILTLAALKASRPNDMVQGYYRIRPSVVPHSVTFKNSFTDGKIFVGKNVNGSYMDYDSPFTGKFTFLSDIKAKAISPQSIGGTTWTFNNDWRNQSGGQESQTDSISVVVMGSNTYTAWFTPTTTQPVVVFQNYSDGVHIGSIIKVDGKDRLSPTAQVTLGATAEAYQYLLANGAFYQFSQWSTGSTDRVFTPSVAGTYTAHYTFQYVLPPAAIDPLSGGTGNNIRLVWQEHPSAYVTEYQVWRKVKDVHGPTVLATLPKTTTSFTDYNYVSTESYTENLIDYDIRARYVIPGVRDVYSAVNWNTVFGGTGGPVSKGGEEITEDFEVSAKGAGENAFFVSPNPFNPATSVTLSLKEDSDVEILVFDMLGRMISRVISGRMNAGTHTLNWNAREGGFHISSGMYFMYLSAKPVNGGVPFTLTRKLLLSK